MGSNPTFSGSVGKFSTFLLIQEKSIYSSLLPSNVLCTSMRLKKHLASKLNKTYMLDGDFFYTPNIRKKTILLADLTIKHLGKPVLSVNKGDTPLERYFKKWGQIKK